MEQTGLVNWQTRTYEYTDVAVPEPHVRFPELGLMAPYFHHFARDCRYEGFMTFFETSGMSEREIHK